MKITFHLLAILAFQPCFLANAQSAASVPDAYLRIQIPAGSVAAPSTTTFSLPLRANVEDGFIGAESGQLTGVTANTFSNANGGWQPGALSQAGSPYFIRLTSGTAIGHTFQVSTIAPNTADLVTVLNQGLDLITLGIQVGDRYEIFPADTLVSFFGNTVMGGTSTGNADVVRIHNGSSWADYYYNTTHAQWREGAVPVNRNNVVLRPDAGITFYRRGPTGLSILLLGRIPHTELRLLIRNSGPTYIGNVFPMSQTILDAGYNEIPGWVTAGSVATADKVKLWNGSSFDLYNYNSDAGQWRIGSVPVNRNNAVIPAGVPVIIERPGTASGVTALPRPLPYNL